MPTNLYGPGDNYHPTHSHVLPALIRRMHEAKVADAPSVTLWGSGAPMREFLARMCAREGITDLGDLEKFDDSIWHIGQAFLKFHFRFPYTVNL